MDESQNFLDADNSYVLERPRICQFLSESKNYSVPGFWLFTLSRDKVWIQPFKAVLYVRLL